MMKRSIQVCLKIGLLLQWPTFLPPPAGVLVQSRHRAPGEEGLQPLQDAKGLDHAFDFGSRTVMGMETSNLGDFNGFV